MATKTKTAVRPVSPLLRVVKRTEFVLGVIFIALFAVASAFTKGFLTKYNIENLLRQGAIMGVLAVAQTAIIITSGIDISGGAIAGLSAMTIGLMWNGSNGTLPIPLILLAALVVSVICGLINGIIIFDLKVPAMIATLGTQTIIRGIIKLLCGGNSVTPVDQERFWLLKWGDSYVVEIPEVFGLPVLTVIWLVVVLVVFLILRYTIFGRNLYVIGSGIEVARLSGIKVRKMHYLVYSFAGLLYGIAGIMLMARVRQAQPGSGEGYDMQAIAAAVIGGASLSGGRGAVTGTVFGTLLTVIIQNAGTAFKIDPYILEIVNGVIIIFAVTMDMVKNRKKA